MLAIFDLHLAVLDPEQLAAQLAVIADRLVERDVHVVPGPVGEILRPGQRAVDAGAADLELVGAFDQLLAAVLDGVDRVGDAARQRHALLDDQLPARRILGHDLQRALAVAFGAGIEQLHAHELEAERLGLGFDHFGQARRYRPRVLSFE